MWKGLFVRDIADDRIVSFSPGISTAIPMLEASPESSSKDFHIHCGYLRELDPFFPYWGSNIHIMGKNRIRGSLSLEFQKVIYVYVRNCSGNQN